MTDGDVPPAPGDSEPSPLPPQPGSILPARPPRRSASRLLSPVGSALAVLLVAGGATVAYRSLSGGDGPRPEGVAPASTFAFVKVDLDLSATERLDLYRFSKRFPDSPTAKSGDADSVIDTLLEGVVDASEAPVDYDRDVKPWLGGAAAVAAYRDARNRPAVVGILGYDDRTAAQRALDDVFADADAGGYAFTDDFVLIAADAAAARGAVELGARGALADVGPYAGDVDALGERLVTVWADQRKAVEALGEQYAGLLGGFAGAPGQRVRPQPTPTLDPELVPEGRVVLGIGVDADLAELEVRSVGGKDRSAGDPGARELATDLPADTTGVLAVGDIRPAVRGALRTLREGVFAGLVGDALTQAERESGLRLPDDLLTLMGHAAAVSATTEDGEDGEVVLRTRPDDLTAARAVAEKIRKLAAADGARLVVRVEGQELVLATTAAAATAVTRGGELAGTELYRRAVGDIPQAPLVVGFLDLRPLLQGQGEAARHLQAVGVTAAATDGGGVFRIRLVVR